MTKPYGYVRTDGEGLFIYGEHQFQNTQGVELIPVYTELPQRTWVGLTWGDIPNEWVGKVAFMEGAKWADKQLKENNT